MHKNQSVQTHRFSMVPRAEIPRSSFNIEKAYKTTFDAGWLIPVYVDEVLPGDTFNLRMTAFARLATPLFPVMDNLHLDSFFFFVPNRLLWSNWVRFMGERPNPDDSIDFTVPTILSPLGGFPVQSVYDYMGLPTVGQVFSDKTVEVNALPLRAYNLIYNEWFRDQNIQDRAVDVKTDSSPAWDQYTLLKRGKRHDYFTSCLPWPQKGESVALPLGVSAPVVESSVLSGPIFKTTSNASPAYLETRTGNEWVALNGRPAASTTEALLWDQTNLIADLSEATSATINQLRQSFQIQKLLERDARGGTRYTEIVRSHFGVVSPDARLQRPEYLGGGSSPIVVNPVAQTGPTTTGNTPLGTLGAMGTSLANGHGFSASFTEHGYIIGLVSVRADLTYQQGLRRMWSRKTRYDFYFPAFAMLGEQAVLSKEIFCTGDTDDNEVFGYQERWAEYRYNPSEITGKFRSTTSGTLDGWHLAQRFVNRPRLEPIFIEENPPMQRILAVGAEANGSHFISDMFFRVKAARPLPMYSVPGLIDHF